MRIIKNKKAIVPLEDFWAYVIFVLIILVFLVIFLFVDEKIKVDMEGTEDDVMSNYDLNNLLMTKVDHPNAETVAELIQYSYLVDDYQLLKHDVLAPWLNNMGYLGINLRKASKTKSLEYINPTNEPGPLAAYQAIPVVGGKESLVIELYAVGIKQPSGTVLGKKKGTGIGY